MWSCRSSGRWFSWRSPSTTVGGHSRLSDDIQITFLAITFATLVLAGLIYFSVRDLSRLLFLYFYIADLVLLLGWRILLRLGFRLGRRGWPVAPQRVLIVGTGPVGQRVRDLLDDCRWMGVELIGFVAEGGLGRHENRSVAPILGGLNDIPSLIAEHAIDDVIIALPREAQDRLVDLVAETQRLPVRVYVVPDLLDLAFFRTTVEAFNGIPMIGLRDPMIEGFPRAVKRAFDIVTVLLFLPLLLPVLGLIALAIKLDSPGTVLYRQRRAGENGKLFWMLKFRSMHRDADKRLAEVMSETADGKVLFKSASDPRVTRVGRFIRPTSLDELPQVFNVLKGDMSLVGPRPEQPWLVDRYESWQRKRFAVPQGMTGWWQVNGRSDKPMHLYTEEDLYYIQNYSLLLDLRILWRTVGTVLRRKGAC